MELIHEPMHDITRMGFSKKPDPFDFSAHFRRDEFCSRFDSGFRTICTKALCLIYFFLGYCVHEDFDNKNLGDGFLGEYRGIPRTLALPSARRNNS